MNVLDALRAKPGGDALADRLQNEIRVRALAKLEHVRDLFPHFTDHSIRHGDGVVAILDWLMPDQVKEQLNEWELYFLVAAAYLHDIGMVRGCPGVPTGDEWDTFREAYVAERQTQETPDTAALGLAAERAFVRDHHQVRSEQYVRDNWVELGLRATDTPAEGRIVGRLCLGHRKVDLSDRTAFGELPFGNNQLIRRNLLGAYLRLADDLDTTAYRTPWAEYEVVVDCDEESALEYAKHLAISGVSSDAGTIVLGGECRDHGVYLRLRKLCDSLKSSVADLKRMLPRPYASGDGFFVEDPLPYHDVELRVEHIGYLPIEVKFTLQEEEIAKLIMGERLYGDQTACVRELLQNAVDTCREAEQHRGGRWTPVIRVVEEAGGGIISVHDNGMGMDEYIVRQYFARVGISYYRSDDFTGDFEPISEFGIGVLSCFMLADMLEVESKRDGHDPIHLEIGSLTEPFVPRRGTRDEPGTLIRLHLKPAVVGTFSVLDRVRHFARHVEFPIEVETSDGSSFTVTDKGLVPNERDLEALLDQRDDAQVLYWLNRGPAAIEKVSGEGERDGVRMGVTLVDELLRYDHWLHRARDKGHLTRVCQRGFYVSSFAEQFEAMSDKTWCEVNLLGPQRLNLTADRTRASRYDDEVWLVMAELYAEIVEDLYEGTESLKTSGQWWSYHDQYYPHHLPYLPHALEEGAARYARFCTFTRDGFRPRGLQEVRDWPGPVYWTTEDRHHELERVSEIMPKETMVLVAPLVTYWVKEPWWQSILGPKLIDRKNEFASDMDFKLFSKTINGQRRRFVDAGTTLHAWWTRWPWLTSNIGTPYWTETAFDARHPFSQLLIDWCRQKLPTNSDEALGNLFARAHTWTHAEIEQRQSQVVELLKEDGVIPREFEYVHEPQTQTPSHTCPYS